MLGRVFAHYKRKRDLNHLKDKRFAFLFEEDCSGEVVVFDTETTGLDPKKDAIVSIGAVKIKANKILTSQAFELFVKNDTIEKKSIEIHGIRPIDVQNGKESQEAIEEFLYFIGSRPLVGYYLEFDMAMINKYLKPMLGVALPNKAIEVSALYYDKKIGRIPQGNVDLRFDTILKDCAIPNMGVHNALNDAIMSAMIYLKLTKGECK
ncbi:MAG: DNA polymerase III subunit epsilon [Sulfurovum sp. FS08-3]|nr:MAG: DNA polymerase III subunit epsilon [Sulfurovum sp. FS08-3]